MEGGFVIGISGDYLDALDENAVSKNVGCFPYLDRATFSRSFLEALLAGFLVTARTFQ